MNMLVNAVQLIGRLGADAEIKTTTQGTKVSNVRFATNEYSKNSKGEWVEITYWHNLVFWGKLAEKLEKNGRKGTRLMIQGSLTYHEYVDAHDIRREVADIRVQQFIVLESANPQRQLVAEQEETEDLPF
ncbi:single-strand binding protein [Sphingobacterium allocomposti]|jgi:single-strand DNA-binding protein|uniref:Single-stranded DNA-binding protein n=1 Tax=Sphingobacterium allocomposti TaxID=415956 RepID=A0A5S5DPE8_9SPHI|nr:single-stranded DNA-binding protein [Sphingobacterium composti Yoo et al. 2007 non Ten et al. 2007]TYP97830.1 single-strand binding protein [Sphingobacterium composti Yoo et al. 2007 non Ten et al. 2007]HLS96392.1 single-stranded DNA-binding protein [Sphingobacterium sp.]